MKRKGKLPELLAPAGSFEALLAAVEAGADAVYVGGKSFGARAYAENFDLDALARAVRYCHLHGVKLYVTVNTLVLDKELEEVILFARELWRIGVDALIVADIGAIRCIREVLPEFELHASTQMSIHNLAGVREAEKIGCSRVVLARECSLADIETVTEQCSAEIEIFLHGALCVSHSGQCLFSSVVGGRSGNRGECAQPCRLPYNGKDKYPLSLNDLSLAGHIRELIRIGVSSLKIEGRMKSPDYVYHVTKIYRRLLDEGRDATKAEMRELADVFSRGGFTDGYAVGCPQRPMTGVRSEADKAKSREFQRDAFLPMRHPVSAAATFRLGERSALTLSDENKSVTVFGEEPSAAQNAPLNARDLTTRLCKMGNTYLSLKPEQVAISLDENINLSPSAINALRRAAADAFESADREMPANAEDTAKEGTRGFLYRSSENGTRLLRTAIFYRAQLLTELSLSKDFFDCVFVPLPLTVTAGANGVALPSVIMEHEWKTVRSMLADAKAKGITYALISNLSHLCLAREFSLIPVGDFRLNVTNKKAAAFYRSEGVAHLILSAELTLPQLRDIDGGAIVYGRIPLMLTERCFIRENGGCDRCGNYSLTDRYGKKFPILKTFEHRNLIFNSLPTYMGDKGGELRKFSIRHGHFIFSTENTKEAHAVLRAFQDGTPLPFEVRRIQQK